MFRLIHNSISCLICKELAYSVHNLNCVNKVQLRFSENLHGKTSTHPRFCRYNGMHYSSKYQHGPAGLINYMHLKGTFNSEYPDHIYSVTPPLANFLMQPFTLMRESACIE